MKFGVAPPNGGATLPNGRESPVSDQRAELPRSIAAAFEAAALKAPGKIAVSDRVRSVTYSELQEQASALAGGLRSMGLARGDTCVVMLDNHVEYAITTVALAYLGAIEISVNTAYQGTILNSLLAESSARLIVCETGYMATLEAALSAISPDHDVAWVVNGLEGPSPGASLADLIRTAAPCAPELLEPWDPACVIYTSGTTGGSKGVLCSNRHALEFACGPQWVDSTDVVLISLPLFHIGGKWAGLLASLAAGATAFIVERFSASRFWSDVDDHRCTQTMLLGSTVRFLASSEPQQDDATHTLKKVVMGPVPLDVEQLSERFGFTVGTCYALTEGTNPIQAPYGTVDKRSGCGKPRAGFEVRLVDENDCDVPTGETGEVVLRGGPWSTMLGYWKRDDATVAAWRNLWLHTGDLLRQDSNGNFHYVGRRHDVIRRRGENISAVEVEQEIEQHPTVRECAVIGVEDEQGDQAVMAYVTLRNSGDFSEIDLFEFLASRLPYFMLPRFVEVLSDLPRTPTDKIAKPALRAQGRDASRTWDCEEHGLAISGKQATFTDRRSK